MDVSIRNSPRISTTSSGSSPSHPRMQPRESARDSARESVRLESVSDGAKIHQVPPQTSTESNSSDSSSDLEPARSQFHYDTKYMRTVPVSETTDMLRGVPAGVPSEAPPISVRKVLPKRFIECPREDLITLVSRMLDSLISINDDIRQQITSNQLTRFHSRAPPAISVHSYLTRLAQYSSLENAILLTSIYYIDLLSSSYPTFSLNSLTVHRFLLTATVVAAKGLCDSFCSNHHYAKVGGVHVSELNVLEIEFLNRVNWRVVPRDFNYGIGERRGSTGSDVPTDGSSITTIDAAADVLDMYYNRMVMLVGKDANDSTVFAFEDPRGQRSVLKRPADHDLEPREFIAPGRRR
ncbi:unnamed protein product [Kuraishia capsulata CBS 1993]|uniref:Cyclin-domain-containing protein n=1 Tax=Kuraishia capsulata CBS 1993 TaxID=1382522 RepID=W6MIS8_9ASCO|nr:uncharacterized protein KUCA_T00001813001 [Kuraishia capsulata CBS 1993]CDK25843.1 unnamed protein product [Kuraishia capsulata CBS 1993]